MSKMNIDLGDDEKERLAHWAKVEGRSQADIIRDAIRNYRPKSRPPSQLKGAISDPTVQAATLSREEMLRGFGE
jgi:predicted transcriptional regulator